MSDPRASTGVELRDEAYPADGTWGGDELRARYADWKRAIARSPSVVSALAGATRVRVAGRVSLYSFPLGLHDVVEVTHVEGEAELNVVRVGFDYAVR